MMINDIQDDDFGGDDFDSVDDGFDSFDTGGRSGGASNTLIKAGIGIGVLVVAVAGFLLFGGSDEGKTSTAPRAPDFSEAPGTNEISPAIEQATERFNRDNFERAQDTGESFLPVPIGTTSDEFVNPEINRQEKEEDPLARWRRLQEQQAVEREEREQVQVQQVQQLQTLQTAQATRVAPNTEIVSSLATAMATQMQTILERRQPQPSTLMIVTDPDIDQITSPAGNNVSNAGGSNINSGSALADNSGNSVSAGAGGNDPQNQVVNILIPAGELEYAQTLTQASTQAPGPVLAQMQSGPFKGARLLGTFESSEEFLIISFQTMVINGISVPINAVALDPTTNLSGVATDVDKRYFRRIVLPAAAAFVEGLTGAIAESGRTNITIQGETVSEEVGEADNDQEVASGVQELGEELGDILDEEADSVETIITVASGTPIGILFVDPVVDPGNNQRVLRDQTTRDLVPQRVFQ